MGWIKLTKPEVRRIRELALSRRYTLREIAERFGISHTNVWSIKHGHTWARILATDALPATNIAGASLQTEE